MSSDTRGYLTQSDLQARRLLDIVLTLLGASGPVSSSRLRELHYPDAQPESFRKLFSRDRQRLALCGITVRRTNRPPDEPLWTIDRERSFSLPDEMDARDMVVLDVACAQLLKDPSFPLANDLRTALAKVDRLFDKRYPQIAELPPTRHDKRLSTLESCLLAHHAVSIRYRRSDGTSTVRCLAPYGMFSLSGQSYLVAPTVDSEGVEVSSSLRTYRVDRIASIKECKSITYVIPSDFSVSDYVLLPFQVGPRLYYADFRPASLESCRFDYASVRNAFVISDAAGNTVLRMSVSDEKTAAAWAIENELVPQRPQSLVDTWIGILNGTLNATQG